MDSFLEVIGFLIIALISLLSSGKSRKKALARQRTLRPPTAAPPPAPDDPGMEEPAPAFASEPEPIIQKREPPQDLRRMLREEILGLPPEPPAPVQVSPQVIPEVRVIPVPVEPEPESERRPALATALPALPSSRDARRAERDRRSLLPRPLVTSASGPRVSKRHPLLQAVSTREGLRQALVVREILGPPRCFEPHGS